MRTSELRRLTPTSAAPRPPHGGGIAGFAVLFALIGFCGSWLFFGSGTALLDRLTVKAGGVTTGAAADYRIDKDDELNAHSHAVSQRYHILGALFGGSSQNFSLNNDVVLARNILEAEDTAPGSIAHSCRLLLRLDHDDGETQDEPGLGAKMVSCYLTLNRPRLCARDQRADLVVLVKGFVAARKLGTDLLGRMVRRKPATPQQEQQWGDHFYQHALGDLRDLGATGYIKLRDFGAPVLPEIKEVFDGATPTSDPCRG
jgi:hypothetical protein